VKVWKVKGGKAEIYEMWTLEGFRVELAIFGRVEVTILTVLDLGVLYLC